MKEEGKESSPEYYFKEKYASEVMTDTISDGFCVDNSCQNLTDISNFWSIQAYCMHHYERVKDIASRDIWYQL